MNDGPTTSQLRARVIAELEHEIAAGRRCAFCHHRLADNVHPCANCGGFSHPDGGGHVVQEWERPALEAGHRPRREP